MVLPCVAGAREGKGEKKSKLGARATRCREALDWGAEGGRGGGVTEGPAATITIQLYYYASHTQQKLVSRWGVGKHITLQ